MPEREGPQGPPDDNPNWYQGEDGQWRLPAHNSLSPLREGQHILVGMVNALLLLFGAATLGTSVAITGAAVLFAGFLAYEITEGWRIRDWAYRDIGGFLTGWGLTVGCWIAYHRIEAAL